MSLNFYGLDLIVGSNIGTVKHMKFNSNQKKKQHVKQLQNVNDLEKGQGVTCMSWTDADQTSFIIGRKNRTFQTFNLTTEESSEMNDIDFGEGKIQSIAACDELTIAAVESGIVKIWKSSNTDRRLIDAGGPIEKMKRCPYNNSIIATGGKENDLKLWDIENGNNIFKAKNISHDWLQLRVPIWVSDICFLPENNGKLIAICSRYGSVRLYDTRVQKRPVCNVEFKDQALSCISLGHYDKHVVVGTGRGLLNLIDLRSNGKLSKSYKGAVGAITDILCYKDRNIVVSTSLDRHLRIHDAENKKIILKQYLSSKLTCLLLRTSNSFLNYDENGELAIKKEIDEEIKEETISDQEYDDLFDNMEIIEEKTRSIKNKNNVNNENKTITPSKTNNKPKKRKQDENVVNDEETNLSKMMKTDVEDQKEKEDDIDASIKKLLKSTEKLKRQLLDQKRKKKSKSLFYK